MNSFKVKPIQIGIVKLRLMLRISFLFHYFPETVLRGLLDAFKRGSIIVKTNRTNFFSIAWLCAFTLPDSSMTNTMLAGSSQSETNQKGKVVARCILM